MGPNTQGVVAVFGMFVTFSRPMDTLLTQEFDGAVGINSAVDMKNNFVALFFKEPEH